MVCAWQALDRYINAGNDYRMLDSPIRWAELDRLNDAADLATLAYIDAYVRHHAADNTSGKRVRKKGKT